MKKIVLFLGVGFFMNANLFALWYQFFPMSSDYSLFNDTAIITSAIVKEHGIKKIIVFKNSPPEEKNSFLYNTRYFNANGNSDSVIECFKNSKRDTFFCTTSISQYNKYGLIENFYLKQANGEIALSEFTEYLSKNETKTYCRSKSFDSLKNFDSILYHKFYNDKNQIIQLNEVKYNNQILSSQIYSYSTNGFLDSVNYKLNKDLNSLFKDDGIYFKRLKKRQHLIVYSEFFPGKYEWIYNSKNQCIKHKVFDLNSNYNSKNAESKYVIQTDVEYRYNKDGTLKEIIEERNDRPTLKLFYFYFK